MATAREVTNNEVGPLRTCALRRNREGDRLGFTDQSRSGAGSMTDSKEHLQFACAQCGSTLSARFFSVCAGEVPYRGVLLACSVQCQVALVSELEHDGLGCRALRDGMRRATSQALVTVLAPISGTATGASSLSGRTLRFLAASTHLRHLTETGFSGSVSSEVSVWFTHSHTHDVVWRGTVRSRSHL